MDLIIIIIKLLIRGLDSDRSPVYQNPPTFIPPAAPPLPQGAQAQMGNPPPAARRGKSKTAGKRPLASAGQKAAPVALAAPVVPVGGPAPSPNAKTSAAPAQQIADALRSPRTFAAAVLMTELLRPPASLRDNGITTS